MTLNRCCNTVPADVRQRCNNLYPVALLIGADYVNPCCDLEPGHDGDHQDHRCRDLGQILAWAAETPEHDGGPIGTARYMVR